MMPVVASPKRVSLLVDLRVCRSPPRRAVSPAVGKANPNKFLGGVSWNR